MANFISKAIKRPGALRAKAAKAGAIKGGKISRAWLQKKAKGSDPTSRQARLAIILGKIRGSQNA